MESLDACCTHSLCAITGFAWEVWWPIWACKWFTLVMAKPATSRLLSGGLNHSLKASGLRSWIPHLSQREGGDRVGGREKGCLECLFHLPNTNLLSPLMSLHYVFLPLFLCFGPEWVIKCSKLTFFCPKLYSTVTAGADKASLLLTRLQDWYCDKYNLMRISHPTRTPVW